MFAVGFLKVFEDAALQLVDMLQPFFAHQNRGLLAADAACAKADHGFVLQRTFVGPKSIRKLAELGHAPVDRAGKRALVDLKGVARVQRHHGAAAVVLTRLQPAPYGGRADRRCPAFGGLHGRVVHADDFALDLDQQFLERLGGRPTFFGLQIGKSRVGMQVRHKLPHRAGLTRQK